MVDADKWLLKELKALRFAPYDDLLPRVEASMDEMRRLEAEFEALVAKSLTKRQAVALGLLARAWQLSTSCLHNQLLQDYAGWCCSYRALLETFFVVDWLLQDAQRFEAFFEGTAPGIGRIKAESCGRHSVLGASYDSVSAIVHVRDRALHLPRKLTISEKDELPFAATTMSIGGGELEHMLTTFLALAVRICDALRALLITEFGKTQVGEVLWAPGACNTKFGCLHWCKRPDAGQHGE